MVESDLIVNDGNNLESLQKAKDSKTQVSVTLSNGIDDPYTEKGYVSYVGEHSFALCESLDIEGIPFATPGYDMIESVQLIDTLDAES